jgi:hypothetical protein
MGSNVIERTDFGRNSVSADLFRIRFRPKLKKIDFGTSLLAIDTPMTYFPHSSLLSQNYSLKISSTGVWVPPMVKTVSQVRL